MFMALADGESGAGQLHDAFPGFPSGLVDSQSLLMWGECYEN